MELPFFRKKEVKTPPQQPQKVAPLSPAVKGSDMTPAAPVNQTSADMRPGTTPQGISGDLTHGQPEPSESKGMAHGQPKPGQSSGMSYKPR